MPQRTGPQSHDGRGSGWQLHVYPNPSHDEDLMLDLPADLRGAALVVRFYDARGAVVAEQQLP
ncbi:MAG: hypothetical protein EOO36_21150, partial [Cytophagaceae bacterium]